MSMLRKLIRAEFNTLGPREVRVVMSTSALARDGHVLVPQGCVLDNYRANPIMLWSHDPDHPIGNVDDIEVGQDQIAGTLRFAPEGITKKADEICGLMKAGVIRAVSVGFDPIDMEPLDPTRPRGGQNITVWELLELSPVSVPADTGAMVTARANGENGMPDIIDPPAKRSSGPHHTRVRLASPVIGERGLYQVANLCYLFEELGWHVDMAQYESSIEGDASAVPGMLAGVLHDLGDALLAMAQEEIAEALAGHDVEPEVDDADVTLTVEERAHIGAAPTPRARAFRRGLARAKQRAGKTLSADTARCLREAVSLHDDAIAEHRSAIAKHKKANAAIEDLMDRAGVSDPDDSSSQTIQTSDGTAVSEGSENGRSADFRRRQAEALGLRAL
jgi:HK97 family phage prohead protease